LHTSVDKFVENKARCRLNARSSTLFPALHNFRASSNKFTGKADEKINVSAA
jgi:hypothetical protein